MTAACLLLSVLMALSLLHVYWACGGRRGWNAALPERPAATAPASGTARAKLFTPSRTATLGVAGALATVALLVGLRAGLFAPQLRHWVVTATLTIVAVVFIARAVGDFRWVGFFKRASHSSFAYWDTVAYSPLCVAIGLGLLKVAFW